jgi:murein DD-endopeptidase MepM/ murein hydrolase activator NlpD
MDAESRSVVAAADGKVVFVNDGCDDRCSTGTCGCGSGFGNYVKLQHTDGESTMLAALACFRRRRLVADAHRP